jgi:hypothetical protein
MATGPSCSRVGVCTEKRPGLFGLAGGGTIDVALPVCSLSGYGGANRMFLMGGIIGVGVPPVVSLDELCGST